MPLSVWKGHLRNEATDATPAVLHCPGKRQPIMPFQDQRCLESRANLDPNWLRPSILNCAEEEITANATSDSAKQRRKQRRRPLKRQKQKEYSKRQGF